MNYFMKLFLLTALVVSSHQQSYDEFANAVALTNGFVSSGHPNPTQAQYDNFIQGLQIGQITTKEEAAMALTHFIFESSGLSIKRELACAQDGCPGYYETPDCDIPNQDYYGRGYLKIYWCKNYLAASKDLYNDNRLVMDADMVTREDTVSWNTGFWFWKVNVHNKPGVSDGHFGVTTKAINGKAECFDGGEHIAKVRYAMYLKVRSAFNLSGDGVETGCYN